MKIRTNLIVVLSVCTCGCGTYRNLKSTSRANMTAYGGVRADIEALNSPPSELTMIVKPFAVIDLPLSLVGDTLTLPLTIHKTAETKNFESP